VEVSLRSRSNSLALKTELSLETSRDPSERVTTSPSSNAREKPDVSVEQPDLLSVRFDRSRTLTLYQTISLEKVPALRSLG
jgi:hypothetical protein